MGVIEAGTELSSFQQDAALAMPLTFNEAYKAWRNRARRFNAVSLVNAALHVLRAPVDRPLGDLEKRPWNLLLLIKWVCQDRMLDTVQRLVTAPEFEELRQGLWDLPEAAGLGIREMLPWRLFLRQRLHQQLSFQRRITLSFVREAALLDAQPENHVLRRMFEQRLGLSLQQFIDITFALAAQIIQDNPAAISLGWFDVFRRAYSVEVVDRYLAAMSLTLPQLFKFCRELPDAADKTASEYFDFTEFTRYPFLRDGEHLHLLHEAVFFRGMEGFVHSVLSEARQQYIEPFSKLFERHVVAEANAIGATFHDETTLKGWVPPNTQTPDGVLTFGTCNVFIESKAGLFDTSVMTVGHSTYFEHKTRALVTAANQAWTAALALRAHGQAPERLIAAPIDYLLIVTNKELSAGRGTALAQMYGEGRFTPPSEEAARLLPLDHIYTLVIDDFEALMAAAKLGEIDLPTFLVECVQRDADPQTMVMYMHQHMSALRVPSRTSGLVHRAIEAAEQRLVRILPGGE